MATHKWYLHVTDDARSEIRNLSSKDRMAVFRTIRELLEAENPKRVSGVKKLEGSLKDQWRARQGDYRIFFDIEVEEKVIQGFTYKGTIIIEKVIHRSRAYKE